MTERAPKTSTETCTEACTEQVKGSVKEAIGKLTGDVRIETDGQRQRDEAKPQRGSTPRRD